MDSTMVLIIGTKSKTYLTGEKVEEKLIKINNVLYENRVIINSGVSMPWLVEVPRSSYNEIKKEYNC